MKIIRHEIDKIQPDILLNFYEPLIGLCSLLHPLKTKIVSIAHQFIYLHPEFHFPEGGNKIDRFAIKKYTQLTAKGSEKLIALSFYPLKHQHYYNIIVCPPLLRKEMGEQKIHNGEHLLVYILNAGYMQEIITWHQQHPEIIIHCFTDSKVVKGRWHFDDTLCFHSLDDRAFLQMMASAKALVTTAGFESVCESMYLGKPVLMVPVKGHFEQWCNARDADKAGAGIYADDFNLDLLFEYLPCYENKSDEFIKWCRQARMQLTQCFKDVLKEQPVAEENFPDFSLLT